MRFSSILAPAALVSLATASTIPFAKKQTESKCISYEAGSALAYGFGSLISAYTDENALKFLAPNLMDTSDSINFLAGNELGSTTFPSREAFMAGQGSQPPVPFQILNIDAVTCDGVIAFRWLVSLPVGGLTVKGINVLYATKTGEGVEGWQISQVFSEFNSGTWLEGIGGTCAPPTAPPSKLFKA